MATKRKLEEASDTSELKPKRVCKVPVSVTWDSLKGDRGCKLENEDRLLIGDKIAGKDGIGETLFFGVFDGHGGHEAAEYASKNLARVISEQDGFFSKRQSLFVESIDNGFKMLQEEMKNDAKSWPWNEECNLPSTAGTTVALAIIRGNFLYTAWAGDSYVFKVEVEKGGDIKTTDITVPHNLKVSKEASNVLRNGGTISLSSYVVSNPVQPPSIARYPVLSMTRALGDYWSFNAKTEAYVVACRPSVTSVNLLKATELSKLFIVIGSDGLTDFCKRTELGNLLAQKPFEGKVVASCKSKEEDEYENGEIDGHAANLTRFAAERAGPFKRDDISCIVLEFN